MSNHKRKYISMKIKIKKIKCLRCGHEWTPRKTDVRMCPKCKSPYFDKAKIKNKEI